MMLSIVVLDQSQQHTRLGVHRAPLQEEGRGGREGGEGGREGREGEGGEEREKKEG